MLVVLLGVRGELEVEVTIDEPYRRAMLRIKTDLDSVFERINTCVMGSLVDFPLMTGEEVMEECTGLRYSLINESFKAKMSLLRKALEKYLRARFDVLEKDYAEELTYFFTLYEIFSGKSFWFLETFELAQPSSKFFVNPDSYAEMMASVREQLAEITAFQKEMAKKKLDLINDIQALLDKRDADLRKLFGESKEKKNEEVEEMESKSVAEEIEESHAEMKRRIEEELLESVNPGEIFAEEYDSANSDDSDEESDELDEDLDENLDGSDNNEPRHSKKKNEEEELEFEPEEEEQEHPPSPWAHNEEEIFKV